MVTRAYRLLLELRLEDQKARLEEAPTYSDLSLDEQKAVRLIYLDNHLRDNEGHGIEEVVKALERAALMFRAQKCAFEDVLTRQGFEPTLEVAKDYPGRIVILTIHGTLATLGKLRPNGRYFEMKRIYNPSLNECSGRRVYLEDDVKINGKGARLSGALNLSSSMGLAINLYGPDGDRLEAEKEASGTIIRSIEETFARRGIVLPIREVENPERIIEV